MNCHFFSLNPFPQAGLQPAVKITGDIERRSNALSIRYEMFGNLEELSIPSNADTPKRKNSLWEETCLEFFLGLKNSVRYWEFNLSPAGHWNVYRFSSYRQGMQEEPAFTSLPFTVRSRTDAMQLSLRLDLDRIIPARQALEVAVSAVVKTKNGEKIYCALTHPGHRADFHLRDAFILEL